MTSSVQKGWAIPAMLLCVSCQSSVREPESLVGADEVSYSDEFVQEIIQINRGFGDGSVDFLSYELRPNNKLVVTLTIWARSSLRGADLVRDEIFDLAPETAEQVRRQLVRVRPAVLAGLDNEASYVWPVGCEPQTSHDFGEAVVVFIDPNQAIGIFTLPSEGSCETAEAVQARRLVEQVLASFPDSEVAQHFSGAKTEQPMAAYGELSPETHSLSIDGYPDDIDALETAARTCGFVELQHREVVENWERLTFPIVPRGSVADPESPLNCVVRWQSEND